MVALATESAGSSDTNMCDYYYQADGDRIALVGGRYVGGLPAGLWCWNFTELSSAYGVVGARLLSLIMGLDVYECWLAMSFALVGGMFWDTLTCGLWYWALDHTSSYVYSDTGARLIIWELMCKSLIVYLYSCRRCL